MEIYTRHITNKLWLFRSFFLILLFICIDSFSKDLSTPGYFSAIILIFAGFIRITGLIVYPDAVKIERYYFFGYIPVRWLSDKNNKKSIRLIRQYEEIPLTPTETLADLVIPFFPVEAKIQGIQIEFNNPKGKTTSIQVPISNKEYDLIRSRFVQDSSAATF